MTRDARTDDDLIALLWRAYDLQNGNPYQGLRGIVEHHHIRGLMVNEGEARWLREMDEVREALRQVDDPRRARLGEEPKATTSKPRPRRLSRGGLTGAVPGSSGATLLEHLLRDDLARHLDGCTEARVPYGRADVATETHVIEVEPLRSWRHGIRQALAYAAQCDLAPGLALFGAASADDVLAMHLRLRDEHRSHGGPHVALWWHTGDARGWIRISARVDVCTMTNPTTDTREAS